MDHLTEEQFLDAVLELQLDPQIHRHLQLCAACRTEVMQLQSATADYKEASTLWADTIPVMFDRPRVDGKNRTFSSHRALVFALSCFVLIALLFASPVTNRIRGSHQFLVAHKDSPAQIAEDNQVLKAMDEDLRYGADVVSIPTAELTRKTPPVSERN